MAVAEVRYDQVLEVLQRLPQVAYESRRLRGWSKRELARRAGVAPSVVTRLEGEGHSVSLEHASAIFAALLERVDHRAELSGE